MQDTTHRKTRQQHVPYKHLVSAAVPVIIADAVGQLPYKHNLRRRADWGASGRPICAIRLQG